jgi:hypothetical protein
MTHAILLDSGPLGLLTAPPAKKWQVTAYSAWLVSMLAAGARVIVPEIADW